MTANPPSKSQGGFAIGLDIGGTRLKCAAVDQRGRIHGYTADEARAAEGIDALIPRITKRVNELRQRFGEPRGIGLGLTGVVDPKVGVIYLPGKFKGLEGFPIVAQLEERFALPVRADNDGRLAMLAERRFGQARNVSWAVAITLGTGVGSGVLLDGRVPGDPSFLFGTQLGHVVLQNYGGKACLTTARGTAETLCSCTALALSVRDGLQRGIPSTLTDIYWNDPQAVDFRAVIEAVRNGDALCRDEFDRWVGNLGHLLVTAVHAYSPRKIILGGGGVHAADLFLPALRRYVHRHSFRYPAKRRIPIVVSELIDRVGVLGAASLFLSEPESEARP